MTKYDDFSWHFEGEFPEELPYENAATHIGVFLKWCIMHDLHSPELEAEASEEIKQVKKNKMTGAQFLLQVCDGKFISDDLNEEGHNFASDYYENEISDFGFAYDNYLNDYVYYVDDYEDDSGSKYISIYHVEDTPQLYDDIAPIIDKRYQEWKEFSQSK